MVEQGERVRRPMSACAPEADRGTKGAVRTCTLSVALEGSVFCFGGRWSKYTN